MRKILTLMGFLLLTVPLSAQLVTTKTLSSATCPGTGCMVVGTTGAGGLGIQVTGTFSGTLTFKSTTSNITDCSDASFTAHNVIPKTATTGVTTATNVGGWQAGVGGVTYFCVVFTSYSSGSAVITMQTAPTTGRVGVGGGGGGGSGDALTTDPLSQFASTTSAQLRGVLSDESGTGAALFAGGALGAATATSINKMAITAPATSSTLAVADGKTLTASNTLTFTGTDTSSVAFGAGGTVAYTGTDINTSGQVTATHLSAALPVAQGGTALTAGTSGGILAFTGTGVLASSAALTANRIVLGGGAGAAPTILGSLGTTTTLLHGNAAGAPTFGAVDVTADVTGILPTANGGTANQFFTVSGPTTSAKTFTFPNASSTILTSNAAVTVAQGGTGLATLTAHGVLIGAGTSNIAPTGAGTAGQVLTSNGASADPTFQTVSGTGTVTSVTTTVPSFLTATGCVITTSGTCAITTTSQNANLFLASPNGSSGVPTMRAPVAADFPTTITENALTTGTTIALYGGAYQVACMSACMIVLPTVSGHTGDTIAVCADDSSALVTLDGTGSETINGLTTRIMVGGECANLIIRAGEWKKTSGRSIIVTVTAKRASSDTSALVAVTDTVIGMDAKESGQTEMWDSGNGRVKAIRPGLYRVTLSFYMENATTNDQIVATVAVNGTPGNALLNAFAPVANPIIFGTFPDQTLAAGDYVQGTLYDVLGGARVNGDSSLPARITLTEVQPW